MAMGALMGNSEAFRFLLFLSCTVVMLGCLGELIYGPSRDMTWAQFLRYAGLAIIIGTIMVYQYQNRSLPITRYTMGFCAGAIVGALGVSPRLRTPIRRPTRSSRDTDTRG
jgi:hypothetical protein